MNTLRLAALVALTASVLAGPARAQPNGKADLEAVQRAVHVCAACHGDAGRSKTALTPSLAGQMREYTIRQLKDFRNQSRAETDIQAYMWGISALLTDDMIEGLADHYAALPPFTGKSTQPRLEAAGRVLFEKGIPSKKVRACASCHGDAAEGASGFPRLAGQRADYLFKQLKAFRTPLRPHGVLMRNEIDGMGDAQLRAVAAYLQSL
jgi:cytochrome c553